jgi:hypothetical protein
MARYTGRSRRSPRRPAASLEKESPSRQGAAVFENSTACAPLGRSLDREVCPGSTPPSLWSALRICLDGGAKIDPVLRPELSVYVSSTSPVFGRAVLMDARV